MRNQSQVDWDAGNFGKIEKEIANGVKTAPIGAIISQARTSHPSHMSTAGASTMAANRLDREPVAKFQLSSRNPTTWIPLSPMSIRLNSHTSRQNIPLPGSRAQCIRGTKHMLDTAIIKRWWRISAAGSGYPLR